MKIIWIAHESSLSGANKSLMTLLKGLYSRNIDSVVIAPNYGPLLNEINPYCSSIYVEKFKWWTYNGIQYWIKLYFVRNTIRNLISIWDISKIIRLEKPDFIISNTGVHYSGAIAAKLIRKKHIWYIREFGKEDHNFKYQFGRKLTFKLINALSAKIIVISNVLEKYLNNLSIKREKITVIYNGIKIPQSQQKKRVVDKELRFICIGRIAKGKNIEIAIEAIHKLKLLGHKSIKLYVFGGVNDTSYYGYLKQEVDRFDLHNQVIFKGYTNQPLKELQNSSIILINSHSEAFGRTTIEAMASKTLVIASNKGANIELINDGIDGIIYDSGNIDSLVEKILFTIKNPSQINSIIENAFLKAKVNFSEERYIDDFYNQIIKLQDEL